MTIWKYYLIMDACNTIEMPAGAEVLTVATQHGQPCLWVKVDPSVVKTRRVFRTYSTGGPMPDKPGAYVGTYQLHGGELVFHVFEVQP